MPLLSRVLIEREGELAGLQAQISAVPATRPVVVAHPVLIQRYEAKMAQLRGALNADETRSEAAQMVRELLGEVTGNLDEAGRPVLDVSA